MQIRIRIQGGHLNADPDPKHCLFQTSALKSERSDHCFLKAIGFHWDKTSTAGDVWLLEDPLYGAGGGCAVCVRSPGVPDPRGLRPGRVHARGGAGADPGGAQGGPQLLRRIHPKKSHVTEQKFVIIATNKGSLKNSC